MANITTFSSTINDSWSCSLKKAMIGPNDASTASITDVDAINSRITEMNCSAIRPVH
jgi:hypothetical protein